MHPNRTTTAAFTGHRTYRGEGDAALRATIGELYARGFRTFLCGMAVGFDLAAAEAVLDCRTTLHDLELIAVIPFIGQESRFSTADRERFQQLLIAADHKLILSPTYHTGCYMVRNNYLVDNASVLVAWYNGASGGTHHTVRRALTHRLELRNLHPNAPAFAQEVPRLF